MKTYEGLKVQVDPFLTSVLERVVSFRLQPLSHIAKEPPVIIGLEVG
jgi:hypothetical protein